MADPVSILAIAALVYAGKKLSVESKPPTVAKPIDMGEGQQNELAPNPVQQVYEEPDRVPEWAPQEDDSFKVGLIPKRELPNFGEIAPQGRSSGAEILGMRDRVQYDTGRMNNLAPIEKVQVGPGLGVDASVPAIGGHQQLFRVNPINVNEHRLTQLEGRTNHGGSQIGGAGAERYDTIYKNRPEKTQFLPDRLPTERSRAAVSAHTPRPAHTKGAQLTNRAETGIRDGDGLEFTPAKRVISAHTPAQPPTRFKADNGTIFNHVNNPAPGIASFAHGYLNSPAARAGRTNDELMALGMRPEDRRGQTGRRPNPGRMNLRENALKSGGGLTSVRMDQSRIDDRFGAVNGGWMQNYVQPDRVRINAFKGMEDPRSRSLGLAAAQLKKNPFAHNIGG